MAIKYDDMTKNIYNLTSIIPSLINYILNDSLRHGTIEIKTSVNK